MIIFICYLISFICCIKKWSSSFWFCINFSCHSISAYYCTIFYILFDKFFFDYLKKNNKFNLLFLIVCKSFYLFWTKKKPKYDLVEYSNYNRILTRGLSRCIDQSRERLNRSTYTSDLPNFLILQLSSGVFSN